jgi:hypothetical protein
MQSEVALGMDTLRKGQRRGIKFNISGGDALEDGKLPNIAQPNVAAQDDVSVSSGSDKRASPGPGRCGGCNARFQPNGMLF